MRADLIKAVLEGQAGLDECRDAMSEALRGVMIKALMDQMQAEVVTLCGAYYRPEPGAVHRRPVEPELDGLEVAATGFEGESEQDRGLDVDLAAVEFELHAKVFDGHGRGGEFRDPVEDVPPYPAATRVADLALLRRLEIGQTPCS